MDHAPRHPERIAAAKMAIINHDRIKAELLHFYCATHWGFDVVMVELSGCEGLTAVTRTKPDVLLLSLAMPDMEALHLIREIRSRAPMTKIVAHAVSCSEYLLHQLAGSEYHGLLLDTEETLSSLGQAIERSRLGLRWISPRILNEQVSMRNASTSFPKLLSRREEQVLICIAYALSDDEIGVRLGFSSATALCHRKKIMRKLCIHSTPKLMRYCADKGFSNAPPPPAVEPSASP